MAEPIDGYAVNYAVKGTWPSGGAQTVVPHCVLCDGIHWHGYDRELLEGTRDKGHKVAHCDPQEQTDSLPAEVSEDGYWLVADPDDDAEYWLITGDKASGTVLIRKDGETAREVVEALSEEVEADG